MKTKILTLLLTTSLFLGCNDEKDPTIPKELPPATQEGKGTAGCYINDELFVLSGNSGLQQTNPTVEFNDYLFEGYKRLYILLSDYNFSRKDISFHISFKNRIVLNEKVFLLFNQEQMIIKEKEAKESIICGARIKVIQNFNIVYETENYDDNFIKFTKIDTQNKIISGIFSFNVKNIKTNEILKVTNGRFDLKMNYTN